MRVRARPQRVHVSVLLASSERVACAFSQRCLATCAPRVTALSEGGVEGNRNRKTAPGSWGRGCTWGRDAGSLRQGESQ